MDMGALRAHIHIYPGSSDETSMTTVNGGTIRFCLCNNPDQNVFETATTQTVLGKVSAQPDTIMSG